VTRWKREAGGRGEEGTTRTRGEEARRGRAREALAKAARLRDTRRVRVRLDEEDGLTQSALT
jgi:hypothetical protein